MGIDTTANPATGEVIATYPEITDGEIDMLIQRATTAQVEWAGTAAEERAAILRRAAEGSTDRSGVNY